MRSDIKVRLAHSVDLAHAGSRNRFYTVNRARDVLCVIEGVVEIRSELDFLAAFTDAEVFEDRKIQILDRRQLKCIATGIRQRAETRLNILSIRIRQTPSRSCLWHANFSCLGGTNSECSDAID